MRACRYLFVKSLQGQKQKGKKRSQDACSRKRQRPENANCHGQNRNGWMYLFLS